MLEVVFIAGGAKCLEFCYWVLVGLNLIFCIRLDEIVSTYGKGCLFCSLAHYVKPRLREDYPPSGMYSVYIIGGVRPNIRPNNIS